MHTIWTSSLNVTLRVWSAYERRGDIYADGGYVAMHSSAYPDAAVIFHGKHYFIS